MQSQIRKYMKKKNKIIWIIYPILIVIWIYIINIALKLISAPSDLSVIGGVTILSILSFIPYKLVKYINK